MPMRTTKYLLLFTALNDEYPPRSLRHVNIFIFVSIQLLSMYLKILDRLYVLVASSTSMPQVPIETGMTSIKAHISFKS